MSRLEWIRTRSVQGLAKRKEGDEHHGMASATSAGALNGATPLAHHE